MTTETPHIRIGHFKDFKHEESILISADIKGLLELEDVFWKLSKELDQFDFSNLKLLDKKLRINLVALKGINNIGIRKTNEDNYEWVLTKEKWGQFREKLTGLYRIGTDGNRNLNSDNNGGQDVKIIFSWNEYSLSLWKKLA